MVALLDVVRLTRDLPDVGLRRGERGTVVEVFDTPEEAYEVEFTDSQGRTTAQVALLPRDVEVVRPSAAESRPSKPDKAAAQVAR